ncbi:MAG: radical SAM protein [Syntrophomonadaceae bacterium]|nr:radical SAM protein [Syntrophomonadaceae bacterium]MDD3022683.1 radical SAM protein [Syntrophomonadaceae bacterium]
MKHINIPIFIPHLGCPFTCLFCNQRRISAAQEVKPKNVIAIVEEHLSTIDSTKHQIEIAFFGGNFTALSQGLQESYLKAVNPYLQRNIISSIRISTRPDCISAANLRFLAAWGVRTIELGVQSFNDDVLKASERGYLSVDVFKACHLICEQVFKLGLQLMIGLPGDNYQRDMESTQQAIALHPDMIRIYPTLVIADTELEHMYAQGRYKPLSLEEAVKITADMLKQFQAQSIPVIRMGLQPSEELRSPGTIIAGPFHPAFGELVEQEIFKEQAHKAIKSFMMANGPHKTISIIVHPKDISKMTGHKRKTVSYLKEFYEIDELKIRTNTTLPRNTIEVDEAESTVS